MTSLRRVVVLALALYLAIVIGVDFHSHSNESAASKLQCNLCQVSQLSVDITGAPHIGPQTTDFVLCPVQIAHHKSVLFAISESKRAPPLA